MKPDQTQAKAGLCTTEVQVCAELALVPTIFGGEGLDDRLSEIQHSLLRFFSSKWRIQGGGILVEFVAALKATTLVLHSLQYRRYWLDIKQTALITILLTLGAMIADSPGYLGAE